MPGALTGLDPRAVRPHVNGDAPATCEINTATRETNTLAARRHVDIRVEVQARSRCLETPLDPIMDREPTRRERPGPQVADTTRKAAVAVVRAGHGHAVGRLVDAEIQRPRAARDPKTELQELAMARWSALPSYSLVADSGVGGDEDRFDVAVEVPSGQSATASSRSKRAAEQGAAELLLERLVADRDDEDGR